RGLFLSSFVVLAVYLADGSLSVCSGGRGLFPSSCFVLAAMNKENDKRKKPAAKRAPPATETKIRSEGRNRSKAGEWGLK
ncbi:hypothetical protein QQP08_008937, partial [Theobroma cacao]